MEILDDHTAHALENKTWETNQATVYHRDIYVDIKFRECC